jgi:hypothetical protein
MQFIGHGVFEASLYHATVIKIRTTCIKFFPKDYT